jgi:hypothetical protein
MRARYDDDLFSERAVGQHVTMIRHFLFRLESGSAARVRVVEILID